MIARPITERYGMSEAPGRRQSEDARLRRPDPTDIVWLAIALLLTLALRIPFLNMPMIHDEGGYAYATRGWINGTGHLYDDLWISRPQGIFVLYAIVFKTLGTSALALRTMAWLWAMGTVGAVWLFARRWTSPAIANTSAVMCAILISLPTLEGFTANAEVFSGMPAAFAMFWLLRSSQRGWSTGALIGIGTLIGISTSLKPSGLATLVAAIAFVWGWHMHEHRLAWIRIGQMLLGVLTIGIISAIHGATLGWHNFFYATVTYRLTMQSGASVGWQHNLKAFGGMMLNAASFTALILLIAGFRIRYPVRPLGVDFSPRELPATWSRRLHFRTTSNPGGLLVQLWIVSAFLGSAMGGDWWTHYLIQAVPPAAMWIAWNIRGLRRAMPRREQVIAGFLVGWLLALPFGVVIDGPVGILAQIYRHPGYPAQAKVAAYVRDHTSPNDTIYVAFDQASIYYLADRRPAYRHLYNQELAALPGSYADIIAILSGPNRPKYIVSSLHASPFPDRSTAFWREVGRYYDLETTIDGVPIYRARGN